MPRFSLAQLLMGTALIAILLILPQTEGCGTRYAMVETLSFSSDGTRILTTKLTARDSRTSGKIYKSNVARTLSWIDASTGASRGVIHQDFKPGNSGPASNMWRVGRRSALCNPSSDHVAFSAFGGGDLTFEHGEATQNVVPLREPVYSIAVSESGRFLAAGGFHTLTVLDTEMSNAVVMHTQVAGDTFLNAPHMSFSADETRIAAAGAGGLQVWEIATGIKTNAVIESFQPPINEIAFAPDDTLIVSSYSWLRRYDLSGEIVDTLDGNDGRYLCCVSAEANLLVASRKGKLSTYDLKTNHLLNMISIERVTCLAMSADGEQVVVGDGNGRVTLFNTRTGIRKWQSNPPGRLRTAWTVPAMALVGWILIAWLMSKRAQTIGSHESTCTIRDA